MMEEVVLNTLSEDGIRTVKIVGDAPIDSERWQAAVPQDAREGVKAEAAKDESLGIHTLVMTWPVCEAVEFQSPCWPKMRRMLTVKLLAGQRVSETISAAKISFFLQTGFFPRLVFMRGIPKDAEIGMLVDGVMLFQAEWAPRGCIVLGGRDG